MSRKRARCAYTVPGSDGGDRCRRFRNHENDSATLALWHLPDCGSAVSTQGAWQTGPRWLEMFEEVKAAGEIHS